MFHGNDYAEKYDWLGIFNRENAPTPGSSRRSWDSMSKCSCQNKMVLFSWWNNVPGKWLCSRALKIIMLVHAKKKKKKARNEEFATVRKNFPQLKQYYTRKFIEYSEYRDGYWTSERFLTQLKDCALIAKCKYPREEGYKVVWVFDYLSCHRAYDTLIASWMNAKPGGNKALLHDTIWNGKVRYMVYSIGMAKGLLI